MSNSSPEIDVENVVHTSRGCFIHCYKKGEKNGKPYFIAVASDHFGLINHIHTFENQLDLISRNKIYEYRYREKPVRGAETSATFKVLVGRPRLLVDLTGTGAFNLKARAEIREWYRENELYSIIQEGDLGTDLMTNAFDAYWKNPKRQEKEDAREVWERVEYVEKDANSMAEDGKLTAWKSTYREKYNNRECNTRAESYAEASVVADAINSVSKEGVWYATKAHHLVNDYKQKGSRLTPASGRNRKGIKIGDIQRTGRFIYVDSAFVSAVLKEGHVSEFYAYLVLEGFLRRRRSYPSCKVKHAVSCFFHGKTVEKHTGKALLWELQRIGMVKLERTYKKAKDIPDNSRVFIYKQEQYFRKYEARWNAWQRKNNGDAVMYRADSEAKKIGALRPRDAAGNALGLQELNKLDTTFRPYLDILWPRRTRIDVGYGSLRYAGKAAQKAFLWGLVASAIEYPICRTRFFRNFRIPKSTQRHYERINPVLEKHVNLLWITKTMWNSMELHAQDAIRREIARGGKFRRSRSGQIYCQEGNSYRLEGVRWAASKKCITPSSKPGHIRKWQARQPVWVKDRESGKRIVDSHHFLPVDDAVRGGRSPRTYISRKSGLAHSYFALVRDGVGIPTTNKQGWRGFEPLMEYDDHNGDRLVPAYPSFAPAALSTPFLRWEDFGDAGSCSDPLRRQRNARKLKEAGLLSPPGGRGSGLFPKTVYIRV